MRVMQGWWGAPEFRIPTGRRHGKRGTSKDNSDMVQTYGTSHTCKGISSRSSRVIPSKRAFWVERVRSGSSRSRAVVEVDVHVAT